MKKIIFITSVLTLVSTCGIISLFGWEPPNYKELSYREWSDFSSNEKLIYVMGYMQGAWTLGHDIRDDTGIAGIEDVINERLPQYYNHDIVLAIDWIYQKPSLRNIPVYLLIARLDRYMQRRYDDYIRRGQ